MTSRSEAQVALDASAPQADPVQLYASDEAAVYHARWQDLARIVERCDALIVDAPYSERTHSGHDDGALTANRATQWAARRGEPKGADDAALARYAAKRGERAKLNYVAWGKSDVEAFVGTWAPVTTGWMVSLTDHELAPHWAEAMTRAGRLVFSPLACVEPGSRVRMVGDGPAQWSCFAIVSRPRSLPWSKWGALPGAYVTPPGHNDRAKNGGKAVTGGKPLWLMERLVEDYSRPGQLVVDPCCGAGTTLKAALRTGRRCVGGDAMLEHAKLAARAVSGPTQRPLLVTGGAP